MYKNNKLFHAFVMLQRNRRSYLLLSITVILTFSLLLGYMFYMDCATYNRYKHVFAQDRQLVEVSFHSLNASTIALSEQFLDQAAELGTCSVVQQLATSCVLDRSYLTEDGHALRLPKLGIVTIPSEIGCLASAYDSFDILWLDGQEHQTIALASGEALMEESLFYALGLHLSDTPEWTISTASSDTTSSFSLRVKVVGLLRYNNGAATISDYIAAYTSGEVDYQYYTPLVVLPRTDCSPEQLNTDDWYVAGLQIYSSSPEETAQLAEAYYSPLSITVTSIAEEQNNALAAIRAQIQTKAIFATALLFLLGINLYSNFNNALSDRKYEIGIKRAIGASAWSIIRQFLYESIFIMLASIMVSVVLVVDGFIVFKYIYEHTPNTYGIYPDWILYLSPYSVGIFLACSFALTTVFSLIFAWKSLRVEIVQQLKSE